MDNTTENNKKHGMYFVRYFWHGDAGRFQDKYPVCWITGVSKPLNDKHRKVIKKIHNQLF